MGLMSSIDYRYIRYKLKIGAQQLRRNSYQQNRNVTYGRLNFVE
jgi:hypothetical protein